jgi:F0F1-type ATP synthase assembly protein I
MSKTAIIITSVLIIGVGVGSFFIGRSVGKKSASSGDSDK